MPELTVIHIVLLALAAIIGAIVGWILRGKRAEQEKAVVNAGWQEQIAAQRKEHERLVEQNKGLMGQVSQFQASHTDTTNRAKELSLAVQEAFARRDELQREIKDIRSNLEAAVDERNQLQSSIAAQAAVQDELREKDARVEKLMAELANWQARLPPLIERFRTRNEEAERLEQELDEARGRIRELECARDDTEPDTFATQETRIEPVHNPVELTDGLDASNDDAPEPEPEPEPEPAPQTEPELEPATAHRDDLKKIKGVGPAIEKTLNEMGIFSFQQIADMSEYDINRVARRLKGFRSRIYREDWIGQARELHDRAAHV